MNSGEQILLTGATGFIGSHVLEKLRAAGFNVVVFTRPNANLAHVRSLQVPVRFGDIRNLNQLREAVRGSSQVIHTAALANDWAALDDFDQTNVVGTMNVLEACRLEQISKAIITGSISSYGEEHSNRLKDETSPYNSHYPYFLDRVFPCRLNWYRDSKALATKQAIQFANAHQMNLTVLEPVWVYGEREFGTGFYCYVKAIQDGQKFMPGSKRNLFHVIYAGDLANAFLLAAEQKLPGVHRFIIGSSAAEPMHRVFTLFCQEAGLRPPHMLPKWTFYPLGFGLELAGAAVHTRNAPLLTRGRVDMFYDSIQYSTDKARRCLGFECDYSLEQGIRQTVAWYKANHYL